MAKRCPPEHTAPLPETGGTQMTPLLSLKGISKNFGGVQAVQDFNLDQYPQQISAIIGPNGAGKTTTFNLITGIQPADSGKVFFHSKDISKFSAHKRMKLGITRTFQNIRLFNSLDVLDNLKTAYSSHYSYTTWEELLRLPRVRRQEKEIDSKAQELLEFFQLDQYRHNRPGNLAYGLQRRLELARTMIPNPEIMLLDEPAAGLNPREIHSLIDTIAQIRKMRPELSIIIVE